MSWSLLWGHLGFSKTKAEPILIHTGNKNFKTEHAPFRENRHESRNKKENILKIFGITESKPEWSRSTRLWPSNSVGGLSTWTAMGWGQLWRCCLLLHAVDTAEHPAPGDWLRGTASYSWLTDFLSEFLWSREAASICLQGGRVWSAFASSPDHLPVYILTQGSLWISRDSSCRGNWEGKGWLSTRKCWGQQRNLRQTSEEPHSAALPLPQDLQSTCFSTLRNQNRIFSLPSFFSN